MQVTINRALVLGKVVRERINDLKGLRTNVSSRRTIFGDAREVTEPTYDIKEVDKRILLLQKIAYQIEARVKEQNNATLVDIADDVEDQLFKDLSVV